MIQVKWRLREVGGFIDSATQLRCFAASLKEVKAEHTILCYFEFDNPDQCIQFCDAIQWMGVLKDISKLETRKKELEAEIQGMKDDADAEMRKSRALLESIKAEVEKQSPQADVSAL
jgi:hypothetical protein